MPEKTYRINFHGASKKDVQQQRKELLWIVKNLREAKTLKQNKKWSEKLERWLGAHPFVERQFRKHQINVITDILGGDQ